MATHPALKELFKAQWHNPNSQRRLKRRKRKFVGFHASPRRKQKMIRNRRRAGKLASSADKKKAGGKGGDTKVLNGYRDAGLMNTAEAVAALARFEAKHGNYVPKMNHKTK